MTPVVYYVLCGVLTLGVLVGIALMSKVRTAVTGNLLSALCMAAAIVLTLFHAGIFDKPSDLWLCLIVTAIGLVVGLLWAARIKMIEMPEIVALFNGFGGAASALVALATLIFLPRESMNLFALITGAIALAVGMITLTGSLIAGGKLHKIINGRPVIWKGHKLILNTTMVLVVVTMALIVFVSAIPMWLSCLLCTLLSAFFGVAFALRVGGADMPITISLLNSLSGVAGSIAGMAIGDPLLVAVGGVVGASGLLLTQIMCKAMNRHLGDILLGKTSAPAKKAAAPAKKDAAPAPKAEPAPAPAPKAEKTPGEILAAAKRVIIVPGYGMALAQAQHQVKKLADTLEADGIDVEFAIHPVAGRMPGHMNVLLAEADVPYEKLHEMEEINPRFADCDAAIVIGANDVTNPAANTAEGTPIYGMPVLDVEKARHIFICNYDLKPGYAGVENPIYTRKTGVTLMLGDAKKTVDELCAAYAAAKNAKPAAAPAQENTTGAILAKAKKVIIVPGYGMALAQAQHQVKKLADTLEADGIDVEFAIHPVAGRMPGHMNVLLAEADVPYEKLHEMEEINPRFADCDAAIVIGANDVTNPAANTAEGTPIYGMPVLDVEKARHIFICNYDLKPGYAGVENPIYTRKTGVTLMLGDAKKTVDELCAAYAAAKNAKPAAAEPAKGEDPAAILREAKHVILIPGYGMALAQAQHLVKQLSEKLKANGAEVEFAIHPVAGRMPGHMNVLLAEADVPYEELHEMEEINPRFEGCDAAVIIGASDVVNPAANTAEGTPIYGMPVLNAGAAKHIIVCNYDDKPGYAGVPNTLYDQPNTIMLLGDAKETVRKLIDAI